MLGLEGVAVPLGLILTLLSTVLCIVYGLLNWNRGHLSEEEVARREDWEKEERAVEETL